MVDDSTRQAGHSEDDLDYGALSLVRALPAGRYRADKGRDVFGRLAGATLIQIGTPEEEGVEGGGLVVDYTQGPGHAPRRLVLAFNENGMWIEYDGWL